MPTCNFVSRRFPEYVDNPDRCPAWCQQTSCARRNFEPTCKQFTNPENAAKSFFENQEKLAKKNRANPYARNVNSFYW